MGQVKFWNIDVKAFYSIGQRLGQNLKGGEVLTLVSDLGGGKTTLTKGIAKGANSQDSVSSPSFTICNEYKTPFFRIYHFDFYRLPDPGIVSLELQEILDSNQKPVVIIEWPLTVEKILPKDYLKIAIEISGPDLRNLVIYYPPTLKHLLKDL